MPPALLSPHDYQRLLKDVLADLRPTAQQAAQQALMKFTAFSPSAAVAPGLASSLVSGLVETQFTEALPVALNARSLTRSALTTDTALGAGTNVDTVVCSPLLGEAWLMMCMLILTKTTADASGFSIGMTLSAGGTVTGDMHSGAVVGKNALISSTANGFLWDSWNVTNNFGSLAGPYWTQALNGPNLVFQPWYGMILNSQAACNVLLRINASTAAGVLKAGSWFLGIRVS